MALSNLQRARRIPRKTQRFSTGETVILNALKSGDKTTTELIEEYCRGLTNGGPACAANIVRTMICNLRKKGVAIQQCSVYRLE